MKAREWLERGIQATDPIDKLANFWSGFNNLYFTVGKGSETEKIRLFLEQRVSEQQSEEILKNHVVSIAYLLSKPVIDMRGNGRDTAQNIEAFNVANNSLTKLQELFMVAYQIRCNLIHGQKSPTRDRDIELCRHASCLVAELVGRNA